MKNILLPLAFFGALFYFVLFPTLNNTTYGALERRYSEITPGSRLQLMK